MKKNLNLKFSQNPRRNLPPLPDPFQIPEPIPQSQPELIKQKYEPIFPYKLHSLREGCYMIRYTPRKFSWFAFFHYDGTLRVQREIFSTTASGDLYLHTYNWLFNPQPIAERHPGMGIPIYPISQYRYYLRVTRILEWFTTSNSFTLEFQMWHFDHSNEDWTEKSTLTATMKWTTAPAEYPSSSDFLTGEVKDSQGTVVGNLTMGWVSPNLRRAVIEIDRVPASEIPANSGTGINWQDIYEQVGWDVDVVESDLNLAEPGDPSWNGAELHAEMLNRRDLSNLDNEWRYHLLCVQEIDGDPWGWMYDNGGTDSNNLPREGAAVASHSDFPNTNAYGRVRGQRLGVSTGPYFRTSVHEIGHAHGLYHNTTDNGIMNRTVNIANNAVLPEQFPDNVIYAFNNEDQKRLRHMSDIWVRAGGSEFGPAYSTAPISPDDTFFDAQGLELELSPLQEILPIGAPVRVNFMIVNKSEIPLNVPANLRMKMGHVKGKVIDPSGTIRIFSTIVRCIDSSEAELKILQPDETHNHSVTLLRGPQGALFPTSGFYKIVLEITWEQDKAKILLKGETSVLITPPSDEEHAKAALHILSTPDSLLTLVIGGDHLKEGIEAIHKGLNNQVLHPHYAFIEAKRLSKRFRDRKPNFNAAADLLNEKTIMSPAEVKHVERIVQKGEKVLSSDKIQQLNKLAENKKNL